MNSRFYNDWDNGDFDSYEDFEYYMNGLLENDILILFASSVLVEEFKKDEDMRFWYEYACVSLQENIADGRVVTSVIVEIAPYVVKWLREYLDGFGETPVWVNIRDGKPIDVNFGMPVMEKELAKQVAADLDYDVSRLKE